MHFILPYATGKVLTLPVLKKATSNQLLTGEWVPAAGDVKVKKDTGSWANIGTLPSESATGATVAVVPFAFTFSAAELTSDFTYIECGDPNIEDQMFVIETKKQPIAFQLTANSAAGATTVTGPSGLSSVDDAYNTWICTFFASDGREQSRIVSDYTGSTRVLTLDLALTHGVATTTRGILMPLGMFG